MLPRSEQRKLERQLRWVCSKEYEDALVARSRIADIMPKLAMALQDREFRFALMQAGCRSIPDLSGVTAAKVLGPPPRPSGFGRDVLAFTGVYAFFSAASRTPGVAAFLAHHWPRLPEEVEAAAQALRVHHFFVPVLVRNKRPA